MKNIIHFARVAAMTTLLVLLLTAAQTAWAQSLESIELKDGAYLIKSADDLATLAAYVNAGHNCEGLTFKVTNDIDFSNTSFDGIGTVSCVFNGTFDGGNDNGYTISRFIIDSYKISFKGLFGNTGTKAVIQNVTISDAQINVNSASDAGGIVGNNGGKVSNCTVSESVKIAGNDNSYVFGGIAGNNGGTIENCTSSAHLTGKSDFGGIAGSNGGTIENCTSSAQISILSANGSGFGGIAGSNDKGGTLTNNRSINVYMSTSPFSYGAIAGKNKGTLQNNYYHNFKIKKTNGTGKGCGGSDVTSNNGAVEVWKVEYPECFELTSPEAPDCEYDQVKYYTNNTTITLKVRKGFNVTNVKVNGTSVSINEGECSFAINKQDASVTADYTILLTHDDIKIAPIATQTYTGQLIKPKVTVKYGDDITLEEGEDKDYTVTYTNNRNVGTAKAKITGTGKYSGEREVEFTIVQKSIETASATVSGTYTFNRNAIEPTINVRDGGYMTLNKGTDFTVTCTNNVNAGTAIATITGIGNYTGTKVVTFTINPKPIDDLKASISSGTYTFSGTPIKPEVSVNDGMMFFSIPLEKDKDFTVKYENNVNAGTATAKITGKGNYTGTKELTFTIERKLINTSTVAVSGTYTYTGEAIIPTIVDGETELKVGEDKDYTAKYSNNINASTDTEKATVTITGKGNYKGSKTVYFTIDPKSIADLDISYNATHTFTGSEIKPEITITYGNTELTKDEDYTVEYSNNTEASDKATVTIEGKGNYTGKQEVTFTISPKSIDDDFAATVNDELIFDGTEKKPTDITVTWNGKKLDPTTDFKIFSYSNNIHAGTEAKVTIEGKGNYTGKKAFNFTIVPKPIKDVLVIEGLSKVYWGTNDAIFTEIKCDGKKLDENVDYTAGYSVKDADLGKYTLTITGINDYAGSDTKDYEVITGDGSEESPYIIKTTAQLDALSALVNGGDNCKDKHFKLGNSIEYDKTENNFTAIGTDEEHSFQGTFDGGNNHGFTISGIRINASTNNQGLFGYVYGKTATIQNVTIEGTKISSSANDRDYYGGIVGYNYGGTIENCTSSATVSSSGDNCGAYGGIVGYNDGGTIENCTSRATVSSSGYNSVAYGGIVGENNGGGILSGNLSTKAKISSSSLFYGAIAGYDGGTLSNNYYYNCTVNEVENATGVGCDRADIEYNDGAVAVHTITLPDGFSIQSPANPTESRNETKCYKAGIEVKLSCVIQEDKVALANNTVIHDNTFTMPDEDVKVTVVDKPDGYAFILPECFEITNGVELIYGGYVKPETTVKFALKFGYKLNSAVTKNNEKITPADGIYTVSISKDSEIKADYTEKLEIATPADLIAFSKSVNNGNNYGGKTIKMIADITFPVTAEGKSDFTPIGTEAHPFKGTFDGGGHTLTFHLRYGDKQKHCAPFSFVDGATFRDLIVDGTIESEFSIPDDGWHGGFVGESNGNTTFENCAFVGSLLGVYANNCGGFVGQANKKITYTNCLFAPKQITMSTAGSNTFNRGDTEGSYSTCYYTQPFGFEQGVKVVKANTQNAIYKNTPIELVCGNYYESAVVEGLRFDFESNQAIFKAVKFGGEELNEGQDYSVKVEVKDAVAGKYTLTIVGQGDYAGSVTKDYVISSGDGTADAPYIIKTPDHLNALSALVNGGNDCEGKHFRLGNSIDFNPSTDETNNFTAIGYADYDNNHPFDGTFDGCNNLGYTISGIRIDASTDYQGLFGYAGIYATIKNVTIEESEIKSSIDKVGGIVGWNFGTIENCTSSATVSSNQKGGGIVGENWGTIKNCTSSATVSSYCSCGGIVGENFGTLTGNLSINAEVSSSQYTGAIAGHNNEDLSLGVHSTLTSNYYYDCNVNGIQNATGVGCYGGDVADDDGAVAVHTITLPEGFSIASPENPTIAPNETEKYYKAGVEVKLSYTIQEGNIAVASNTVINDNTFTMPDEDVVVKVIDPNEYYTFILPSCFEITNGCELVGGKYIDPENATVKFARKFGYTNPASVTIDGNELTAIDGIYTVTVDRDMIVNADYRMLWAIYTPEDLKKFSEMVNSGNTFEGETVTLMNSISFTAPADGGSNFTAIGNWGHQFLGTFDGGNDKGYTISGIRINAKTENQGLFGYVGSGATILNVTIKDSEINSSGYYAVGYGGIAGRNYGTISNCTSSATVTVTAIGDYSSSYGGIVGENWGTIKNCTSSAKVTASGDGCHDFGGIVGDNEGTLTGNFAIGAEISSSSFYGAIASDNNGILENNYYYDCKVKGTPNATDVGCNSVDIESNNGAVAVHKLTLLDGITTPDEAAFKDKNEVPYFVHGSEIELSVKNYYLNGKSVSGKLKINGDCLVSNGVPDIQINGDGDATVSVPELAAANVTYTRSFSAGIYTTIMLPFDFTPSDFGGEKFYTFSGVNSENWTATMDEVAADAQGVVTLKANTPYIFQPSEATAKESTFTFENVAVTNTGVKATTVTDWTFHGTYKKIVWNEDETKNKPKTTTNVYGFAATKQGDIAAGDFVRAGYNASIRPTRAYLEYTGEDKTLSKSSLALPDRIKVVFIDKETATVIDDPNITDDPNGDISTPTSEIQPALESVKVWSYDKTIYISARPGTDYRIIDANGRLLRTATTQSDRDEVRLGRSSGIVIVIIGNKAYKVSN